MCIEELVGCNDYVKRKAADMLEKLATERDAKKPEETEMRVKHVGKVEQIE